MNRLLIPLVFLLVGCKSQEKEDDGIPTETVIDTETDMDAGQTGTDEGSDTDVDGGIDSEGIPCPRPIEISSTQVVAPACHPEPLKLRGVPAAQMTAIDCPECVRSSCDVVVEIAFGVDDEPECPDALYAGIPTEEKEWYVRRKEVMEVVSGGIVVERRLLCPLPKLPAPRHCDTAGDTLGADAFISAHYQGAAGWYYCEYPGETFVDACDDDADNDLDGDIDCADGDCVDCVHCGGTGATCSAETCRYSVKLTEEAAAAITGYAVYVQCLELLLSEDDDCRENDVNTCNNGRDDDGNGMWDCRGDLYALADPYCCPMDPPDAQGVCRPRLKEINRNCGSGDWVDIPACRERIIEEDCLAETGGPSLADSGK